MKKIFMVLAFAGLSTALMAQEDKYEVQTNRFLDNWFVSGGVGAEMLFSNSDSHGSVSKRISPTFNVGVGKWFTPGLGLRMQYSGFQSRGYSKDSYAYVRSSADESGYYRQKFHYMNLHGDVLFNLNALIGGYNPDRIYEVIPFLGAGFTHSFSGAKKSEAFAMNAGVINRFRVSPVLDVNLEVAFMAAENKFDRELGGKNDFDGVVSATAGVTYYFKNRGFNKAKACPPQTISEAELSDMRNKMNELVDENRSLKDELAAAPTVIVEKETEEVTIPEIAPHAVFFTIGSSVVSPQELVNLGFLADQIKEYPELKLKMTGYADAKTGTPETNRKVSIKRAEAVADALAKTYGINRANMSTDAAGGVDKFDKEYLNRMVMIEVVK